MPPACIIPPAPARFHPPDCGNLSHNCGLSCITGDAKSAPPASRKARRGPRDCPQKGQVSQSRPVSRPYHTLSRKSGRASRSAAGHKGAPPSAGRRAAARVIVLRRGRYPSPARCRARTTPRRRSPAGPADPPPDTKARRGPRDRPQKGQVSQSRPVSRPYHTSSQKSSRASQSDSSKACPPGRKRAVLRPPALRRPAGTPARSARCPGGSTRRRRCRPR